MRTGVLVHKVGGVLLLLRREVLDQRLAGGRVHQHVAVDLQVLPHNQRLHRPHIQTLQRVLHPEAKLPRVLANLVKVPDQGGEQVSEGVGAGTRVKPDRNALGDQLLLLDELHVRQDVCGQLNRLIEPVLAAVRHVANVDDDGLQSEGAREVSGSGVPCLTGPLHTCRPANLTG